MSEDCCTIDVTLTTNPVEVTVEGEVIDATISNDVVAVEACDANLVVDLKPEVIKIEFPDPDTIGPPGPTPEIPVEFLYEEEDICNLDVTRTPKLVIKEVTVDGCRKFKILLVEDAP